MKILNNYLRGTIGGGLLGVFYYFLNYRFSTVLPTCFDWLMSGDRASHFLGWLYFLSADWSFPIGRIDACVAPVGGFVAFTDSIPWFAVIFKILAPIWNQPIQYSGLWLLCCFFLQGYMGALLATRFSERLPIQLLFAAFFILNPQLLWRSGHIALNGQFLLLAAIYLYVSGWESATDIRKSDGGVHTVKWTLLCAFSAGVHPYLAMMVLLICAASYVHIWLLSKRNNKFRVALHGFFPLAACLLVLYIFGYFSVGSIGEAGFGKYSANLDTLLNSQRRSLFFQGWPVHRGQYEGFGYLGAGLFLLVCIAAGASLIRPGKFVLARFRSHLPMILVVGGMFVYSLATPVYWHRYRLLRLDWLYQNLQFITSTFRASGRFVWPLVYCLTLAVLVCVLRRLGSRWGVVCLILAVAIQFADLSPLRKGRDRRSATIEWNTLKDDIWHDVGQCYNSLVLVPPFVAGRQCWPSDYRLNYYVPFAFLAATHGMDCNSGYMPRMPQDAVTRACESLFLQLSEGVVDSQAVYIVDEQYLGIFSWWTRGRLIHRRVDGYHLFTSSPVGERGP